MEPVAPQSFLHNWQRKLCAILGAIIIWMAVNASITATKTIGNVPLRLINLPADRTVEGLLPNGLLSKRAILTITGSKDVVDSLESSDLELVVDADSLPDESILQVSKKNLISLNPDIDLGHHITAVSSSEFVLRLIKLITDKIPISFGAPTGEAPDPYQFLDIWPQQLFQTVTGPEEQVRALKDKGLVITLDLDKITKAELDAIQGSPDAFRSDEVAFSVPDSWKKVVIPFATAREESVNDPISKELVISFLRKEPIPFAIDIPVRVYYPVANSIAINPKTHPIVRGGWLTEKNNITLTPLPLLASEVSRWFVDVIRDNIEITIVAAPRSEREQLQWGIEIANLRELEDTFVTFLMSDRSPSPSSLLGDPKKKEARLRRRFRDYVQKLRLYKTPDRPLRLDCRLQDHSITAKDVSAHE